MTCIVSPSTSSSPSPCSSSRFPFRSLGPLPFPPTPTSPCPVPLHARFPQSSPTADRPSSGGRKMVSPPRSFSFRCASLADLASCASVFCRGGRQVLSLPSVVVSGSNPPPLHSIAPLQWQTCNRLPRPSSNFLPSALVHNSSTLATLPPDRTQAGRQSRPPDRPMFATAPCPDVRPRTVAEAAAGSEAVVD